MSMLAVVSQVEPASNNSMLLTLFVCIFDAPHIVLFIHGFFASYTKEVHVQSRQFLG
jgi:esterase/lipase superfamily enzyme